VGLRHRSRRYVSVGLLRPGPAAKLSRTAETATAKLPTVRDLCDRLLGREAEAFGMGPAVVLGQDLADLAWAVCDSAVAHLAARDRQMGDSDRRAAGT